MADVTREIRKGERISSCFFEGMSKEAVGRMVSESFVVKQPASGNLWKSSTSYFETNINFEMRIDPITGKITNSYIK